MRNLIDKNSNQLSFFKKKATRLVTHNTYNSYTESLFKDNGLLDFCRYVFFKQFKTLTQIIS